MAHSKISYRNWAIATYDCSPPVPRAYPACSWARLGIKQSTAWFLLHRLREAWRTLAGPDLMAGPVEVD